MLRLVTQGLANKQIARALGITERTVKAHLGRVFREIGVARPHQRRTLGPRPPPGSLTAAGGGARRAGRMER